MKCLNIRGDAFHPEWNYGVIPRSQSLQLFLRVSLPGEDAGRQTSRRRFSHFARRSSAKMTASAQNEFQLPRQPCARKGRIRRPFRPMLIERRHVIGRRVDDALHEGVVLLRKVFPPKHARRPAHSVARARSLN
jgi:hypothetical protein